MTEEEFNSVLSAAQEGADWAWDRIYRDLAGRVLAYLRRRGASDPENLLGEVFLQLARNITTFTGTEDNFRSWVFTVAHHRVLDEHRRATRKPADLVAEIDEPAPQTGDDTADAALESIETDRVQALIEQLVPSQQEVLLLRIVAGLTITEIADTIGKKAGAVKALQRRGFAALQRIIEREGVSL